MRPMAGLRDSHRLQCAFSHAKTLVISPLLSENGTIRDPIRWGVAMTDVTRILNAIERGDAKATDGLLPLVYEELRLLAAQKLCKRTVEYIPRVMTQGLTAFSTASPCVFGR